VIFLLALLIAFGDIAAIKTEPAVEKRSELALANAEQEIDEAKKAYRAGDEKAAQAALDEVAESVDVSLDALKHSHGAPRNSKYYKRAELKLRALTRKLTSFRDEVNFESRQPIDVVIRKMSDVHDQLITDIMSKKK
jgi:hypothetical protein